MSYEPTVWKDGDLVTSAKLNKMEEGIASGSGILVVNIEEDDDALVMDKTWQEIYNAPTFICTITSDGEKIFLVPVHIGQAEQHGGTRSQIQSNSSIVYYLTVYNFMNDSSMNFYTEFPNNYPIYEFNQIPNNPGEGAEVS